MRAGKTSHYGLLWATLFLAFELSDGRHISAAVDSNLPSATTTTRQAHVLVDDDIFLGGGPGNLQSRPPPQGDLEAIFVSCCNMLCNTHTHTHTLSLSQKDLEGDEKQPDEQSLMQSKDMNKICDSHAISRVVRSSLTTMGFERSKRKK